MLTVIIYHETLSDLSLEILYCTIRYLQHNSITGSLPGEWGSMGSLSNLCLHANRITGSLPEDWVGITASTKARVALHHNRIEGTLPERWANLKQSLLRLSHNKISGTLPKTWGSVHCQDKYSCCVLDLASNQLSGSLPAAWPSGMTLCHLYLQNNAFSGPLSAWSNVSSGDLGFGRLEMLDLR